MRFIITAILALSLIVPVTGVHAAATNRHVTSAVDTDRDGYPDVTEILYNYDHKSPCGRNEFGSGNYAYGKGRLLSLENEQCRARFLKLELERIVGKGNIHVSAKNWNTVVNSFIYGGYSVDDIVMTMRGVNIVHPSIPKNVWAKRKTATSIETIYTYDGLIQSIVNQSNAVKPNQSTVTVAPASSPVSNAVSTVSSAPVVVSQTKDTCATASLVKTQSIYYYKQFTDGKPVLSGKVIDEKGNPLYGIGVIAIYGDQDLLLDNSINMVTTDIDGEFVFNAKYRYDNPHRVEADVYAAATGELGKKNSEQRVVLDPANPQRITITMPYRKIPDVTRDISSMAVFPEDCFQQIADPKGAELEIRVYDKATHAPISGVGITGIGTTNKDGVLIKKDGWFAGGHFVDFIKGPIVNGTYAVYSSVYIKIIPGMKSIVTLDL